MVNGEWVVFGGRCLLMREGTAERISMLDVIGQIFWFGILATPLIAFFIVRKAPLSLRGKIIIGIIITGLFAVLFYVLAMTIFLRDGLGPG
jgi:hypothetical protein